MSLLGTGEDTIDGGAGQDAIYVVPDLVPDVIDCGEGRDILYWADGRDLEDVAVSCERQVDED